MADYPVYMYDFGEGPYDNLDDYIQKLHKYVILDVVYVIINYCKIDINKIHSYSYNCFPEPYQSIIKK